MYRSLLVAVLLLCTACAQSGLSKKAAQSKQPEGAAHSEQPAQTAESTEQSGTAAGTEQSASTAEHELVVDSPRVSAEIFKPGAIKPVQNPQLVSSIDSFLASKTPETRLQMFAELNKASYLVPLQRQSAAVSQYANFELPGVGQCMPVFSDFSEAVAAGLKGQQLQEIQAADLWHLLENSKLDCVLVNPGTRPLPLRRHIVELIRAS